MRRMARPAIVYNVGEYSPFDVIARNNESTDGNFATREKVAIPIPIVTCTLPIPIPIFGIPIPTHISSSHLRCSLV